MGQGFNTGMQLKQRFWELIEMCVYCMAFIICLVVALSLLLIVTVFTILLIVFSANYNIVQQEWVINAHLC
jgi:flagellar biosynthesis protein FliP